jgi:hypothetical protein
MSTAAAGRLSSASSMPASIITSLASEAVPRFT